MTASELQAGGLRCSILGTFYIDVDGRLRLGSDIENFMSLSRLRAYKPTGEALSMIVNHVNPEPTDFLARRTAVLGMTRTGKSNTVKTTVSAVALAAMKDNIKVGQLIFDVNGEYANANHQDD
nr:hypothetical protein [Tanacetum cinerariifolium]